MCNYTALLLVPRRRWGESSCGNPINLWYYLLFLFSSSCRIAIWAVSKKAPQLKLVPNFMLAEKTSTIGDTWLKPKTTVKRICGNAIFPSRSITRKAEGLYSFLSCPTTWKIYNFIVRVYAVGKVFHTAPTHEGRTKKYLARNEESSREG